MLWNEPNNLSHWNFEIDPEWSTYAEMVKLAAKAVQAENLLAITFDSPWSTAKSEGCNLA